MALTGSAILGGGTCAATGGSAVTFSLTGQRVQKGAHFADVSADYDDRRQFIVEFTPPIYSKVDKTYTKSNTHLAYMRPFVLPDGTIVYNILRMKQEMHPLFPNADQLAMRHEAAQFWFDADFSGLWLAGQTA